MNGDRETSQGKKVPVGLLQLLALGAGLLLLGATVSQEAWNQGIASSRGPRAREPGMTRAPLPEPGLTWQRITDAAPWSQRDAHGVAVFRDQLWVLGGLEGIDGSEEYWRMPHTSDVWASSDGIDWKLVTDRAPWGERRSLDAVEFQNRLWMLGGWGPGIGYRSDVWATEDGEQWTEVAAKAPWDPREGHAAAVFNGKLWIFGGVRFDRRELKNDVWYTEDGEHWVEVAAHAPWSPRYDHTVSVFQGKLWLIGGLRFGEDILSDVWVSRDGSSWERLTDAPPWPGRHGHSSLVWDNRLWIIGGWSNAAGGLSDTWYTADGRTWTEALAGAPWKGREDHAAAVFKDAIWITGGMNADWQWEHDVWRLIRK